MEDVMAYIVHWKDIATKHYGDIDEFERITKDLIFCARTGKNPKEAFKGITLEKQAAYEKTRYLMRHAGYEQTGKHIITEHGWYTAYLDGEGLAFKCTIPQETRKLITLAQYIEWQQNNSLEDAAEEYYETRGIVNSVASGMSERHTRKDIYDDEGGFI